MSTILHKIQTFWNTPRIMMIKFVSSPLYRFLPDKLALEIRFKNVFHRPLNLDNPKTFNEKLQWLKLYDRKPEYTDMVDKFAAKNYAANIIGEEHIIPTLGVFNTFDEIDFNQLPNQFVLKCTHGSGDVVICKDKNKFDKNMAKEKLIKALRTNYYLIAREWPYKNVKPRIIAEKLLSEHNNQNYDNNNEIVDYKFYCFNGQAKCIGCHFNRFTNHTANYYDLLCNRLDITRIGCPTNESEKIIYSNNIKLMKDFSEQLSSGIPFLRTDFYNINGNIYFGELTFYPSGGFGRFTNDKVDYQLGEWLQLPIGK